MEKIKINNNNIEAIILPHIGGRLVSLRKNNGLNIIKSDPTLWNDKEEKPALDAFSDFKAYNGHTVWVGPQCDWWIKQNSNDKRKQEMAMWPPDPFLIYGDYSIEKQTESNIILKSPESPISHVQLFKEYAINPDGSIFLKVVMVNNTNKDIEWDIWFNTRMDGMNKAYVPISKDKAKTKIEHVISDTSSEMPYSLKDGFFTYTPTIPEKRFNERSSKTFIYPEKPYIAGFSNEQMLLIQFEKHPPESIHPQQSLVEIYNHTEHNPENALLELEYHSPYFKLKPDAFAESFEVWKIFDYNGANIPAEHISFLKELEKKGVI